jgi:hypothetical protein
MEETNGQKFTSFTTNYRSRLRSPYPRNGLHLRLVNVDENEKRYRYKLRNDYRWTKALLTSTGVITN